MMGHTAMSEELLAYVVEKDFRKKGYEVLPAQKLDFLPDFIPDLVVRRDGETRVVEIGSRSSLATSPQLTEWARTIHSRPGWSFQLVLLGEPEKLESPEGLRPFEVPDVHLRIQQAEAVLASGLREAAFLLAWTACEAAIRICIAEPGSSNARITTSGHLLDLARFVGVISRGDYRYLTDAQRNRNAVAHGFGISNLTDASVTSLLETARRILGTSDEYADG